MSNDKYLPKDIETRAVNTAQEVLSQVGLPANIFDIEGRSFIARYEYNGSKEVYVFGRVESVTLEHLERGTSQGWYVYVTPRACTYNGFPVIAFEIFPGGLVTARLNTLQKSFCNESNLNFYLLPESFVRRMVRRFFRLF